MNKIKKSRFGSRTKPKVKLGFVEDYNLKFKDFLLYFSVYFKGRKVEIVKKYILTENCDYGKKLSDLGSKINNP